MLFLFLFHRVNSIPYSGGSSNSRFQAVHLVFRRSKLFQLYHFKAPSNHCKASILFFSSFTSFWSFFYCRSSSRRLNMMICKDTFHSSIVLQDFSSFIIISIHSLFQSYRWIIEDLSQVCAISLSVIIFQRE